MVNHGYPWLTMDIHVKTKKYHNSTQNCPFSMIFVPKCQKFHGDSFPDVKRSKFLYIWRVLTIVVIFWKNIFPRSKIRKSLGVPTATRPTPAEVPYGTIRYHKVPYGTMWYPGRGGAGLCWDATRFSVFRPWKNNMRFNIFLYLWIFWVFFVFCI